MNRKMLLALTVLALSATLAEARPEPRLPTPNRAAPYRPGELLVLTSDWSRVDLRGDGSLRGRDAMLQAALGRHGLNRYRAIGNGSGRSQALTLRSDLPGFDPVAAAADLRRTGAFRAVAPNLRLDLYETVPNDPYLIFQWQIRSTPENTDVQVTDAWDVWKGDTSTVIAIMDVGFDIGHPDLASQVWINRGEIPGNGLDDDGNGYIDDVKGWDFANHDNDPSSEAMFDSSGIDFGFHGTFVAGIAAATNNNNLGIAGAGWKCRFMPLKVANTDGDLTLEAVAEAFPYMIAKHPAVLNMSFGTRDAAGQEFFQALVDDATAADILVVAGAGNDGTDAMAWPAACDHVLSVGATAENNTRASFSNYGSWVDVAAPGSLVCSSICRNYVLDDLSYIIYFFYYGYDGSNPYMYGDGTSYSSPLVAGVAALLRSKMPSLHAAQIEAHLIRTGDVIAYDHPIGPRVNAYRAVTTPFVVSADPDVPNALSLEEAWPNPFSSATTVAFTLPQASPVRLAIHDPTGRRVRLLINANLPSGRHAIRWDGMDGNGRSLRSGVYFVTLETAGFRGVRKLVLAH